MLPLPYLPISNHISNILSETVCGGGLTLDGEIYIVPVLSSLYVVYPLLLFSLQYFIPFESPISISMAGGGGVLSLPPRH